MSEAEIRRFREQMARLEELVLEAESAPESEQQPAREMARVLLALHRIALGRLLEIVGQSPAPSDVRGKLAGDEITAALLLLHGLQPQAEPSADSLIPLTRLTRGKGTTPVNDAAPDEPEHEQCELCKTPLPAPHEHLLDAATGRLSCACTSCAIASPALLRVSPRVEALPGLTLEDSEWQRLGLPIELAFFVRRSDRGSIVGYYPSPTGAIESSLPMDGWQLLQRRCPELSTLATDVEALIVNRTGGRSDYFRVSIDECFALVGIVRRHYRGVSGGAEVWTRIASFFEALARRARPTIEAARADRELEAACPS
jgi:hypothetical protein